MLFGDGCRNAFSFGTLSVSFGLSISYYSSGVEPMRILSKEILSECDEGKESRVGASIGNVTMIGTGLNGFDWQYDG